LTAIESGRERQLLLSGFRQFINPFESIIEFDTDRLLELPKNNVKSAYNAAKKAKDRIDGIIKKLEDSFK